MNRIDRATKRAVRARERQDRAKSSVVPADFATRQDILLAQLTRAHCVKYDRKDWNEIARRGLVTAAPRSNAKEMAARKALARYEPGVIDSLFGLGKDRRRELAAQVLAAARADQAVYEKARKAAEVHNIDINAAAGVLALDINAIEQTLKANIDRAAIGPALEGFALMQAAPGRFIAFIDGLEYDAMPDETCMIQPDGAAAFTPVPTATIRELHLSNICSISLRVGADVLASLGVDAIEVVTRCHLPAAPGRESEPQPVLHVKLPHAALARMDLRKLEPVSTVTALGGRLDWDVTRGFAPIGVDDLKLHAAAPSPQRLRAVPPQAIAS